MQLSYPLDTAAYEKEWSRGQQNGHIGHMGQGLDANGAGIKGIMPETRHNTLDVMFLYNYYLFKYVAQAKKGLLGTLFMGP